MIETLLKLGISGSEIVGQKIKQIQKAKKEFEKPATLKTSSLASITNFFSPKKQTESPKEEDTSSTPSDKPAKEKEKSTTSSYDRGKEAGAAAKAGLAAAGGLDGTSLAQAAIKGTLSLAGPIGSMAADIANSVIDAAQSFRDKVKQSANLYADTMDAKNMAIRYAGEQFKDYIVSSRSDIDRNAQRAIVSSLGSQYGKFSNEFREQVEKLFSGKVGGKFADAGETTSLAQGNFAALGTDKGFFMQKIADSFGDLPPTMKQKLMGQLFSQVSDSERSQQTDYDIKSSVTTFDDMAREKAGVFANDTNVKLATNIQELTDTLDTKLSGAITKLTQKIEGMIAAPDTTQFIMSEIKGAILDLKSTIMGAIKGGF